MALIALLLYKIKLAETLESAPSDSTPSPRRRAAPPSPHAAPLPSPPSAAQLLLQCYTGPAYLSLSTSSLLLHSLPNPPLFSPDLGRALTSPYPVRGSAASDMPGSGASPHGGRLASLQAVDVPRGVPA